MTAETNFLTRRKSGIGGSDCAAICGFSKWKTPYDVWIEKTSQTEAKEDNDAMMVGRMLENTVLELYKKRTQCEFQKVFENNFIQSAKYPWLIGHVDAMAAINDYKRIVEAKTTAFYSDAWGEEGSEDIPIEYKYQVANYCLIASELLGKNIDCDIAVLGATHNFKIYHYSRDFMLELEIIDKTHDFWHKYVLTNTPPPPVDESDLKKLYPVSENINITAENEVLQVVYELRNLKAQLKELGAKETQLENIIKAHMKNADTLVDEYGVKLATWRTEKHSALNTEQLKKENSDICEKYKNVAERRIFRIK